MNKATRTALAKQLAEIAGNAGAVVTITHGSRDCYVNCEFADVSVSFDLDNLHRGGILASWYRASKPLALRPFDSVNECHRHKATLYRDDAASFIAAFTTACAAVADGSAFQPETT